MFSPPHRISIACKPKNFFKQYDLALPTTLSQNHPPQLLSFVTSPFHYNHKQAIVAQLLSTSRRYKTKPSTATSESTSPGRSTLFGSTAAYNAPKPLSQASTSRSDQTLSNKNQTNIPFDVFVAQRLAGRRSGQPMEPVPPQTIHPNFKQETPPAHNSQGADPTETTTTSPTGSNGDDNIKRFFQCLLGLYVLHHLCSPLSFQQEAIRLGKLATLPNPDPNNPGQAPVETEINWYPDFLPILSCNHYLSSFLPPATTRFERDHGLYGARCLQTAPHFEFSGNKTARGIASDYLTLRRAIYHNAIIAAATLNHLEKQFESMQLPEYVYKGPFAEEPTVSLQDDSSSRMRESLRMIYCGLFDYAPRLGFLTKSNDASKDIAIDHHSSLREHIKLYREQLGYWISTLHVYDDWVFYPGGLTTAEKNTWIQHRSHITMGNIDAIRTLVETLYFSIYNGQLYQNSVNSQQWQRTFQPQFLEHQIHLEHDLFNKSEDYRQGRQAHPVDDSSNHFGSGYPKALTAQLLDQALSDVGKTASAIDNDNPLPQFVTLVTESAHKSLREALNRKSYDLHHLSSKIPTEQLWPFHHNLVFPKGVNSHIVPFMDRVVSHYNAIFQFHNISNSQQHQTAEPLTMTFPPIRLAMDQLDPYHSNSHHSTYFHPLSLQPLPSSAVRPPIPSYYNFLPLPIQNSYKTKWLVKHEPQGLNQMIDLVRLTKRFQSLSFDDMSANLEQNPPAVNYIHQLALSSSTSGTDPKCDCVDPNLLPVDQQWARVYSMTYPSALLQDKQDREGFKSNVNVCNPYYSFNLMALPNIPTIREDELSKYWSEPVKNLID